MISLPAIQVSARSGRHVFQAVRDGAPSPQFARAPSPQYDLHDVPMTAGAQ